MELRNFRKLVPEKTLITGKIRVVNDGNDTISMIWGRNNDMQRTTRNSERGNMTNALIPKNKNAARKPQRFNSSLVPRRGKFDTEAIDALKVSSGLHEANQGRLVGTDGFEDVRSGVRRGEAPTVPTKDFKTNHKNNNGELGQDFQEGKRRTGTVRETTTGSRTSDVHLHPSLLRRRTGRMRAFPDEGITPDFSLILNKSHIVFWFIILRHAIIAGFTIIVRVNIIIRVTITVLIHDFFVESSGHLIDNEEMRRSLWLRGSVWGSMKG